RTVQALVRAAPTHPFSAAIVAGPGNAPAPAVNGEFLVAGSVHVLGFDTSTTVVRLDGGVLQGMRNNYQTLNGRYELDRIARRQLICPGQYPTLDCSGGSNLVESVQAELKVYGNITNTMVQLVGPPGTDIGQSADTLAYGQGGNTRAGKGRIDGIYVADGCPLPCTTKFSICLGCNVYVDQSNYTKPYPYRPPRSPIWDAGAGVFPSLNGAAQIAGVTYASYSANFFQDKTTNVVPAPLAPLTNAYLGSTSTPVTPNGYNCLAGAPGAECRPALAFWQMFDPGSGSFTRNTPAFRHSFEFMDKTGTKRRAEICWKRTAMATQQNREADDNAVWPPASVNLPSQAVPVERDRTLEFGIPDCNHPNPPATPILILWNNAMAFSRPLGPAYIITYRGSAIIMNLAASGTTLQLEETLISYCTVSTIVSGTQCVAGERFPDDHLLVFLNKADVDIGMVNANVDSTMAYIWQDNVNGKIAVGPFTHVLGSLRGYSVCFVNTSAGACTVPSGAPQPMVYHVYPLDWRRVPEEIPGGGAAGPRWNVDIVPRFWMVCRPGTLPSTPTGVCGY
ncbi:MAG TPA: hypothetical protein VFN71_02035, partial [Methylomirabilota bacterium]|nr:hypothetical protein [Methylomirabilota bacterium]